MSDTPIQINGSRRWVIGISGTVLFSMMVSIGTFWFGFYPTIATEAHVEKFDKSSSQYSRDKKEIELRLKFLEENYQDIKDDLKSIKQAVGAGS